MIRTSSANIKKFFILFSPIKEFRKAYPGVKCVIFGTNQELIDALLKNEIKAIIQEELFMEADIDRLGLPGDILARPEKLFPSTIHAGVLKDNLDLLKEINQGFKKLEHPQLIEIENRWVTDPKKRFYHKEMASAFKSNYPRMNARS